MLSSKLYETQSHLMLTGHIMNAQLIVINEKVWQKLTPAQRDALSAAAQDVRKRASEMVKSQEAEETEKLKGLKMNVIGPDNGLKLDALQGGGQQGRAGEVRREVRRPLQGNRRDQVI